MKTNFLSFLELMPLLRHRKNTTTTTKKKKKKHGNLRMFFHTSTPCIVENHFRGLGKSLLDARSDGLCL
jgi:hypothetical protein